MRKSFCLTQTGRFQELATMERKFLVLQLPLLVAIPAFGWEIFTAIGKRCLIEVMYFWTMEPPLECESMSNIVNVNTTQPADWAELARKAASLEGVSLSEFIGIAMVDRSHRILEGRIREN
jgi:hypothetical protein